MPMSRHRKHQGAASSQKLVLRLDGVQALRPLTCDHTGAQERGSGWVRVVSSPKEEGRWPVESFREQVEKEKKHLLRGR